MKTTFLFFLVALSIATTSAQDFSGYRSGNYTGVNSVFFNPANIADSRYRFDFNLVSAGVHVGNNQASFKLKNISNSFDGDEITDKIFGGGNGKSSGFVSADVHGPSLMFNAGRKTAIAFTTRGRVMANVTDLDGKLADKIRDGYNNDPTLPYTISSSGAMRTNVNAWSEYGFSFARVISDKGPHFFKAGATLKYLAGAGNAYLNVANLNGTLNQDNANQQNYLSNTTGQIALGFGGIRVSDFEADQFSQMESTGFGADIGFVYEYRPQHQDFRKEDGSGWKKDMNKYKWKIGVALHDIGSIKYDKDGLRSGAYNIDITGNERFNLEDLEELEIDDYNSYFTSRPQYFTPAASNAENSYKVALPATLEVLADYHLHKGLYVSLNSQFSLISKGAKPYNSAYYSTVILTPRFEGKALGLYLPISYNKLTSLNAGVSLRLGPLFVGSGSVLTALAGNSKQADAFVGLRFGGLR